MSRSLRIALPCLLAALSVTGCAKAVPPPKMSGAAESKVQAAKGLIALGKLDSAAKILDMLTPDEQRDESAAKARFDIAEGHFHYKNWSAARESYKRLLAHAPQFRHADAARYHLGLSALEMKLYREAHDTIAPLFPRLGPSERGTAAAALTASAEALGMFGEAARWELERARSLPAADRPASNDRVAALAGRAPTPELERLVSETPKDSTAWPTLSLLLGKRQLADGRKETALETFEAVQSRAPDSDAASEARTQIASLQKASGVNVGAIGAALPLSGRYRGYGESVLEGIKLALRDSPIELVVKDTAGDPDQAKRAVAELAETDGVFAIVGPVSGKECIAAAAEAESRGVPIITLTSLDDFPKAGPNVFRNMTTWRVLTKALADYAVNTRGIKRFAVLAPQNAYGKGMTALFKNDIQALGGTVTRQGAYPDTTTTFRPVINQLVTGNPKTDATNVKIDFDGIFLPDTSKNIGQLAPSLAVANIETRSLCKDVSRKGLRSVLFLGAAGWNAQDLVDRAQKYVMCSVFVDGFFVGSERPQTKAFVDAFQEMYSRAPNQLAASGYDSAKILREISERQRPRSRADVRAALRHLNGFIGATGPTRFGRDGEVDKPVFFITVDEDGLKEIVPEPQG